MFDLKIGLVIVTNLVLGIRLPWYIPTAPIGWYQEIPWDKGIYTKVIKHMTGQSGPSALRVGRRLGLFELF
jgi:hypothetical protein